MDPEAGIKKVSVILPSYNPSEKILEVIHEVIGQGFCDVIVINDGSREQCAPVFDEISKIGGCTVITHEVNKGKGAGLKTGFKFFEENRKDGYGVVTIDDDGQHLPGDIRRCAEAMVEHDVFVLGVRDFRKPEVPARSRAGNVSTAAILRIFIGIDVSDTQTGLRAIPAKHISALGHIRGNRFEYETNVLLSAKKEGLDIMEVPIETVYAVDHKSHYRTFKDSFAIIKQISKYSVGSIVSCGIDILGFFLLLNLFNVYSEFSSWAMILLSTFIARVVSSTFNFMFNKNIVFKYSGKSAKRPVLKYCLLCLVSLLLSGKLVAVISAAPFVNNPFSVTLIKIVVDAGLFMVNYVVQRKWVYR